MSNHNTDTILALDLGTATGWAASIDGVIQFGTWCFKSRRFEGGGMRYLRFRQSLDEMLTTTGKIDALYFEEVRAHRGTDAAHVYGGLLTTLTSWCEMQQIPYSGVPVGTIKKHATGKGNANKRAMIDVALAKGWNVANDNEADALHLLDYALTQYITGEGES